MIRFSRREDYAVILVNKLVQNFNKRFVPLSEIANEYNISLLFLRNLAYTLRQANIINAKEGKDGGYSLVKNPNALKVGEVLGIFSRNQLLECCPAGKTGHKSNRCPKEAFCDPGFAWRRLNKEFLDKVYNLTFKEFLSNRNNE